MDMTLVKSFHTMKKYLVAQDGVGYLVLWMGQVANSGHGEDGPVVGHEVEHPYVWAPLTGPRTHSSSNHCDVRGYTQKNPKQYTVLKERKPATVATSLFFLLATEK